MFERIKESFFNIVTSRIFVLLVAFFALYILLIARTFDLQIVQGEEFLNEFLLKTEKTKEIASTRGNIYDKNGVLLAYSELAYVVKLEDVYETRNKNRNLNETIYRLIKIIEGCGDQVINEFGIEINENGDFAFSYTDSTSLLRFKADVYGERYVTDLEYKEETATAEEMIEYLAGRTRFGVGNYEDPDDSSTFVVGMGYTKEELLQIVTIRYTMNLTSFQKYLGTTIATDVSDETVAAIMENLDTLDGVSIEEDTARRYVDSVYFSPIIGYTGRISSAEMERYNELLLENDPATETIYELNDVVGKAGIEAYMELDLQGTKGSETVFVDNLGKVIEVNERTEPIAGNDIYLSIDHDLQIAAYNILEQNIAGILASKIRNIKEYIPTENASSSDIVIPIYEVYFALFNNNILDISHFSSENAGENEKAILQAFEGYKASVFERLREELLTTRTAYRSLPSEYQVYESNIVTYLTERGIIDSSLLDDSDATYQAWRTEETIGLGEFLEYSISAGWIDVTKLNLTSQYSDSDEIFLALVDYIVDLLDRNYEFNHKLYRYMLRQDVISGRQVCLALCEQGIVEINPEDEERLYAGSMNAYDFMLNRINYLEITPAQLALDPSAGSMVITDVNSGDVLALVSYPGYDNNRLVNTVDAEYFTQLQLDLSRPLFNYATQQTTAPGSIFKMVSASAGLEEGVIGSGEHITCLGIFEKMNSNSRCWIYPRGTHGSLNVSDAIKNSCNFFFYEVGYRLSMQGDTFSSEQGLERLAKYADYFGLSEKSGVEIEEAEPRVSDELPILSAIGQGTNNYTTVGLSRYVATVANNGTCYDLTLLDKLTDHNGNLLKDYQANVRNTIDMSQSTWNNIHSGMRKVIETKSYYNDLGINVAGKTGTAEESKSRPNHALFVCYAPYESPEIAISTRIAFGYSSDYAARTTREVIKYYFELEDEETLIDGNAESVENVITTNEF